MIKLTLENEDNEIFVVSDSKLNKHSSIYDHIWLFKQLLCAVSFSDELVCRELGIDDFKDDYIDDSINEGINCCNCNSYKECEVKEKNQAIDCELFTRLI